MSFLRRGLYYNSHVLFYRNGTSISQKNQFKQMEQTSRRGDAANENNWKIHMESGKLKVLGFRSTEKMEKRINTSKILIILSLTANILLLLLLHIISKGRIGSLCFDENKAALVTVNKTDCYIMDYIKDNMSHDNTLPSREQLNDYIRKNPFLSNSSVEIIYSPQNLISFRGNKYNVLIFDKKTGM